MKIFKILSFNILIFLFSIGFIELIFGYWFDPNNLGPYMREHRMKKIFTQLNTIIKLMILYIKEIIMVLEVMKSI